MGQVELEVKVWVGLIVQFGHLGTSRFSPLTLVYAMMTMLDVAGYENPK